MKTTSAAGFVLVTVVAVCPASAQPPAAPGTVRPGADVPLPGIPFMTRRTLLHEQPSLAGQATLNLAGRPQRPLSLAPYTQVDVVGVAPNQRVQDGGFVTDDLLRLTWYHVRVLTGEYAGKTGYIQYVNLVPRAVRLRFTFYYDNPDRVPDRAFERAARWQLRDWEKHCREEREKNNAGDSDYVDVCLHVGVKYGPDFKANWTRLARQLDRAKTVRAGREIPSVVESGYLFTHASIDNRADGLEFAELSNPADASIRREDMAALPRLPWEKAAASAPRLFLQGCNTGVMRSGTTDKTSWCPAQEFAKAQRVSTQGERGFSIPSSRSDRYVTPRWTTDRPAQTPPAGFPPAVPGPYPDSGPEAAYLKAFWIGLNKPWPAGDGSPIPPAAYDEAGSRITPPPPTGTR